jgi:hypothetical protein
MANSAGYRVVRRIIDRDDGNAGLLSQLRWFSLG